MESSFETRPSVIRIARLAVYSRAADQHPSTMTETNVDWRTPLGLTVLNSTKSGPVVLKFKFSISSNATRESETDRTHQNFLKFNSTQSDNLKSFTCSNSHFSFVQIDSLL